MWQQAKVPTKEKHRKKSQNDTADIFDITIWNDKSICIGERRETQKILGQSQVI